MGKLSTIPLLGSQAVLDEVLRRDDVGRQVVTAGSLQLDEPKQDELQAVRHVTTARGGRIYLARLCRSSARSIHCLKLSRHDRFG